MVFVLDRRKRPLMPCSEKRARILLRRGRAVVHRLSPFTIRLKDRRREESVLQPVGLKLDPGSKVTGVAIVRREETPEGPRDHVLHLAEVAHRGDAVRGRMRQRAAFRRRRRSADRRYRAPRFANRRRPEGWLPPSLGSRVDKGFLAMRRRGEGVANYLITIGIVTAALVPLLLQALGAVQGVIQRFINSLQ